jgi:dihydrofolate reductase
MSRTQVYCAISLDGFIAGPNDDLSWLEEPGPEHGGEPGTVDFPSFMQQTGAILMGRRTFDIVMGFGGEWPYGTTPVLVATSRPLPEAPATVSTCHGNITKLCDEAKRAAGDKNVYLDGGNLISQAIEAGSIDEMILTVVPVLLGQGVPLYQGEKLHRFHAEHLGRLGSMLQVKLTRPDSEAEESK